MVFVRPEVILRDWQGIKIQLLHRWQQWSFFYSPYSFSNRKLLYHGILG